MKTGIGAIFSRLAQDVADVVRVASPPHSDLRDRLLAAISISVVVDIAATLLLFWVERRHPDTEIHNLWDAFFFTTSQMVTISAPMANPVTWAGQALCLLLDLYAITIVSTVAGMFGAFFYHRSDDRRRAAESRRHGAG